MSKTFTPVCRPRGWYHIPPKAVHRQTRPCQGAQRLSESRRWTQTPSDKPPTPYHPSDLSAVSSDIKKTSRTPVHSYFRSRTSGDLIDPQNIRGSNLIMGSTKDKLVVLFGVIRVITASCVSDGKQGERGTDTHSSSSLRVSSAPWPVTTRYATRHTIQNQINWIIYSHQSEFRPKHGAKRHVPAMRPAWQ